MNMIVLFLKTTLKPVVLLLLLFISGIVVAAQTCKNNNIPVTTSHLIDNFNGTISDPKTGLIWKKCSEGQSYISSTNSCNNAATGYTWAEALQQAQDVNAGLGGEALGQNDWRVPNTKELLSIIERSCINPAINEYVFPATPYLASYWSSSYYISNSFKAWGVEFYNGDSEANYKSDGVPVVRLVRSGQ